MGADQQPNLELLLRGEDGKKSTFTFFSGRTLQYYHFNAHHIRRTDRSDCGPPSSERYFAALDQLLGVTDVGIFLSSDDPSARSIR
jgi:hypothetical protein